MPQTLEPNDYYNFGPLVTAHSLVILTPASKEEANWPLLRNRTREINNRIDISEVPIYAPLNPNDEYRIAARGIAITFEIERDED